MSLNGMIVIVDILLRLFVSVSFVVNFELLEASGSS